MASMWADEDLLPLKYSNKESMSMPPRSPRWSPASSKQPTEWSDSIISPFQETTTSTMRYTSKKSSGRNSHRPLTDADEAEQLTQATSQAMIAARSILLSGGSEATALSTAKAAATSILAAPKSESEGKGRSFLGRRKGKRQAEVVASMALLSVKQSLLQQRDQGSDTNHGEAPLNFMVSTPTAKNSPTRPSTPAFSSRSPLSAQGLYDKRAFQPSITDRQQLNGVPASPDGGISSSSRNSQERLAALVLPSLDDAPLSKTDLHTKSRGMTLDIVENVPDQDPIYYTEASHSTKRRTSELQSYSFSSSSGSESSCSNTDTDTNTMTNDTYDDDTVEASTIAKAIAERNRAHEESRTDIFLSTLSSLILCDLGPSEMTVLDSEFPQGRDEQMHARSISSPARDNGSLQGSQSDDDDDEEDSLCSASSKEILKELNAESTDKPENVLRQHMPLLFSSTVTDSIMQSIEQLVQGAWLASNETTNSASGLEAQQKEPSVIISLKHQPGVSPEEMLLRTESTRKPNRLKALSQKVKLQSWLKRRKAGSPVSSAKAPTYE